MKKNLIILVIVIFILGGFYLIKNYPFEQANISQQINNVGVLVPLTGDLATWGEAGRDGIVSLGLENPTFTYEDTECLPAKAVNAFKKLSEVDQIQYFIGPACGSPQEAIVPLVKDKDVVVILPVAASAKLYEESGGKVFQLQYSLEDESAFIAEYLNEKDFKKVALISYQNAFSEVHAETFKNNFNNEIKEISIVDIGSDINTDITKIKQFEPDVVFVTDVSFFLDNGLDKLAQAGIQVPVYSLYITQYSPIRAFVEGVLYSFPGDLEGDYGAEYDLPKEAAHLLSEVLERCNGEYNCVLAELADSDRFNDQGISNREIIMKKIENGQAVRL